ncbi:YaiI/YqxD family protein [Effusibacillus dendaii]|uniref:UPF0178 protein skT53_11550 n=1 Tax=Effusibacillus dendaii TaxID=2743772 RepID=A0A7I8DCC8_9BACL|nr:DUF188 domain-containing protein [Effusibacillus dendaii]BCJ86170.1 hypothetical protein skT53_11550 [Effusibacillus dendaii]
MYIITIWVDADGCPRRVVETAKRLAAENQVRCWTVSNFHHQIEGEFHITVDDTSQSADLYILNRCQLGDLVITQDIGLAALVLGKKCRALGIYGQEYREDTIDLILEMREGAAKHRRAGGRTKGPKRRTEADDAAFETALDHILKNG